MGIRNPNAANLHKQSRNRMFWERIATPVCGLARNDRLFYMQRPMPTMTLIGVALPLFYPSSSPVMSATSGSMKKPSRMPRFSAMSAFFRRV